MIWAVPCSFKILHKFKKKKKKTCREGKSINQCISGNKIIPDWKWLEQWRHLKYLKIRSSEVGRSRPAHRLNDVPKDHGSLNIFLPHCLGYIHFYNFKMVTAISNITNSKHHITHKSVSKSSEGYPQRYPVFIIEENQSFQKPCKIAFL